MPEISHVAWPDVPAGVFDEYVETMEREQTDLSMHPRWVESVASAHSLIADLCLCVARDGDRFSALPYRLYRRTIYGIPLRVMEPASNIVSYHPDCVGAELCEALLERLLRDPERPWDLLDIRNLLPEGRMYGAVARIVEKYGLAVVTYPSERSPYVPLDGGWEEVFGSRSKKSRYNLKRVQRRLAAEGEVTERWYFSDDDITDLLPAMLEVEARSWKVEGGMAISENQTEIRYYELLLPLLVELGALAANVLLLDSRPIAYSLCYRWRGRWGQLKTSFDNQLADFSPGAIVNSIAIQRACEIGDVEFDFLGDTMHHKKIWTDKTRDHHGFFIYNRNARGRAAYAMRRIVTGIRKRQAARSAGNPVAATDQG